MFIAKYQSGSSVILSKHNDIDYIYFYDNKEEARNTLLLNKTHEVGIDKHYAYFDGKPKIFLGCYIYPFMKLIEGQEIKEFTNFSIFEHKEEYKKVLEKYAKILTTKSKQWYHILTACYMFENGKMELTGEQMKKVVKTHDKGISKSDMVYCFKFISKI